MRRILALCLALAFLPFASPRVHGEAMLQLFNVNWDELLRRLPEIAEAGYTSLWLPPPAKAGSGYSVGYDLFDPFDLGDKDQRGTVRTRYGTKAELLQVVELAHRLGLRVYFDNIVNHRGFDVPGYNAFAPTNLYPGLVSGDFHLQRRADGFFRNWPSIGDWGNVWEIQHQPLSGLVDLANEPGPVNGNFGLALGDTTPKPVFIRQPANPQYYMDTNQPPIAGPWRPFAGAAGDPVPEDVNAHLIRAALWLLSETKCDGFRLDAVKHTPAAFFGATSATPDGYTGGLQTIFDWVHGYGNNALGNGYVEGDDSRNSCYDSEAPRNDALLFGEHLGEPPAFQDYLDRGMRLLNAPYHSHLNGVLGNPSASLSGLDQRDFRPSPGAFPGQYSVLFAQSHDDAFASRRELHNAYNFLREGIPCVYSDGYNHATAAPGEEPFPRVANAPFLGQFGDNKMPDLAWLHHHVARGGTRPRWSDADIVAFERYDYREVNPATAYTNPDATVALFVMNDNYAAAISFDDGVAQTTAGTFYECFPVANSRGRGLVVGFPPGSVLAQLADSPNQGAACSRLLVREATANLAEAQATATHANPVARKVYVGGQALAPGGGAVELKVPSGGYVIYAYEGPQPSRASLRDAITFRQGGAEAPRVTVLRRDGVNGDPGFNPLYPFKLRGRVDAAGNVVGGVNLSNRTYAIDIPVLTNAPFDLLLRSDASTVNTLVKLDGGVDVNSQMGLGPLSGLDRRDHRPGYATDFFLGYEQAGFASRFGPEKFAARDAARNTVVSAGAETCGYFVGGTNWVVNGATDTAWVTNQTAAWVHHDPAAPVTAAGQAQPTQRLPLNPAAGADVEVWVKVGYKFQINRGHLYYTTDGSNPEGSFGTGRGAARVVPLQWVSADSADANADWWRGVIPASNQVAGAQVRYRLALFKDNAPTVSDADGAKLYGLTQFGISNFNPVTATVWLHNNLNSNHTAAGLAEGFHLVRARAFLPRSGKASVGNTFVQTFYYDAQPPGGAVAFPPANGATLSSASYQVVVRADATVTGVEFNIQDSNPNNDDAVTGRDNGNGSTNGVPKFAAAFAVTPDPGISPNFPGYPQEFRFNYPAIPSSGAATLTIRLKDLAGAVLTNRVTTLARAVFTAAPAQVLQIAAPAVDGQILVLQTNAATPLRACYSASLTTTNIDLFSVLVNGVLQPRRAADGTPLYRLSASGCGTGLRELRYDWTNSLVGTNSLTVRFSDQVALTAQRAVRVVRPGDADGDGMSDFDEAVAGTDADDPASVLRITELADGQRLIVWSSVPGARYQVFATTNLTAPMLPVGPVIPATAATASWFDDTARDAARFYRIQVVP